MKCLPKILLSACAALSAMSCVHQAPDLDDCDTGLRLLFDWISSAPRPETDSLSVFIDGTSRDYRLMAAPAGRDLDIFPGRYNFTAWEDASNVTVSGTVVTVATATDGLAADPQGFTAGTTTDVVMNGAGYQEVHVPMYQQTRDLIIRMRFTGDGVSLIRSASGTVSGIALSREIIYGFPPVDGRLRPLAVKDGSVGYAFTEGTDGWFTGRRTLLGLDGDSDQMFTVTVGFDDDYSSTEQLEITAELNTFHTENVDEPWVITIVMEVGVSFDMVIIDWYSGAESWLEAE